MLFNIYLNIKKAINLLNEINLDFYLTKTVKETVNIFNPKSFHSYTGLRRSFSTSVIKNKDKINNNTIESLENIDIPIDKYLPETLKEAL